MHYHEVGSGGMWYGTKHRIVGDVTVTPDGGIRLGGTAVVSHVTAYTRRRRRKRRWPRLYAL